MSDSINNNDTTKQGTSLHAFWDTLEQHAEDKGGQINDACPPAKIDNVRKTLHEAGGDLPDDFVLSYLLHDGAINLSLMDIQPLGNIFPFVYDASTWEDDKQYNPRLIFHIANDRSCNFGELYMDFNKLSPHYGAVAIIGENNKVIQVAPNFTSALKAMWETTLQLSNIVWPPFVDPNQ